ncbi:hypothetical protein ACJWDT_16420 [Enterobacter hormaechei]|uniref:hypothetical protein n=1 Tax=Enterobacter hormaechei TaxID=158836 RepID=UPI0012576EFB|nr:hypothetical protein [Enterobacter hormaechei]MCU3241932.1 hypothetical protein [Enterobacter hormaechei subsp. steigerwaltii]MCL8125072.1 hypothetical protein [Enterobacter hormaechei]MCM7008238.1 hypothetical protein [Enterobacter hormaechei]MCU3470504.1 hypothetical protein [Enterobacter hormaechei subsp. steigerwaltii]MCW4933346.1 hypothetical protein [Enterobacter hormaechei subsp. xiangfangensis]
MTVSTVVDHNDYTGNGVTTSFPYTFRIFKKTDLAVSVVDLNENITVLVLDTDYTVTNAGGYNGGNVILNAPLANGWKISIARELEPTQETDLRNQGKFFAEVHEDAFDKLTMLIQQAYSMFRLALRKPSSIANWYDALNNYIRNLRDPSQPQDAATKNYVDVRVEQSNQTNQNLFKRTLRVPEDSIPQLQPASVRSNKILAFDSAGNPIFIVPQSGSASDLLIELAKLDSTVSIAGITAASVTGNVYATGVPVEEYGIKAGEVADVSKLLVAFNSAAHLLFSKGTYQIPDFEMPSTAKCKKITVKSGSMVQMNGYNCVFNITDNFTIDLSGGGVWHGGLKKALVTTDTAVGAYSFPVDNGAALTVGDRITTSFLIPEGDASSWKWSNSELRGEMNYITGITGNVVTVKNPVEQRTLMRNVYVGNWTFSAAGIGFKGEGNVVIIGGEIKEFKSPMITAQGDVKVVCRGTSFSGMTVDAFYVLDSASMLLCDNFKFTGCYDFGKQGFVHASSGDIYLLDGEWQKGNADDDVYAGSRAGLVTHGKVKAFNVTFTGTSLLPLKGTDVDSVTGQTANQLFGNRISPTRWFATNGGMTSGAFDTQGYDFVNCQFLNYQRGIIALGGNSYNGNIIVRTLNLRDVVSVGCLFDIRANTTGGFTTQVRDHELRDLSVYRRYAVAYYPLFFTSSGQYFVFSGALKYDAGGLLDDHRISTDTCRIDDFCIQNTGSVVLASPTNIGNIFIRQASVSKIGTGQINDFTPVTLSQSGTLSGDLITNPTRLNRMRSVDFAFNANDSTTWVTLFTSTTAYTRVDVRIELAPRKTLAAGSGLCGVIAATLNKDGTSVGVVVNVNNYISGASGNLAVWEGKVFGTQGAIADNAVHVRCLSTGEVQININSGNYMSGVAFVAGV